MADRKTDRELALLPSGEVSEAHMRAAGIVLAGRALEAAGGDWDAAAAMLRGPLEAIGAIWYEPGVKPGTWGHPRQVKEGRP